MKLLFDFLPVLLFFVAYKVWDIFVATGVLIVASVVQIAYMWRKSGRVEPVYLITFILVLIFGGLTIILHDVEYLKWKVSVINWLLGAAFLLSHIFMKKPLIQFIFEKTNRQQQAQQHFAKLPRSTWANLNIMWGVFFLILGTVNVAIIYTFSTNVWVNFKVFGILGLTVVFMIIQSIYLLKKFKQYR